MKTVLILIVIIGELLGWSNAQDFVEGFSRRFLGSPIFSELSAQKVSPKNTEANEIQTFAMGEIFIAPKKSAAAQNPRVSAASAILIDIDSGSVMFEQNADEVRPVASITKIVTALVVLDNVKVDQTMSITGVGQSVAETGSNIWFFKGEELRILDVVKAMLIGSGNDAAYELAYFVGKGSIEKFVEMMNQKAIGLGLRSMRFVDPAGIYSGNIASARDLANLGRILLRKPILADFVSQRQSEIVSIDGRYRHELKSTNELLKDFAMHVVGIKTGTTDEAGQCLLAAAEKDGHRLVSLVLDSPDRFAESKMLLEWGFSNFVWPE